MRMNRDNDFLVYDIVNNYIEEDIYRIIKDYGEERFVKRIVNFIVNRRGEKLIEIIFELVDIIKVVILVKVRREGLYLVKRIF